MSEEQKGPSITPGTRVRTEFTKLGRSMFAQSALRREGIGVAEERLADTWPESWRVKHEDGTSASYERGELTPIEPNTAPGNAEDPRIETTDQLRAAMARVSFERSCLDMGWVSADWMIRCSFRRPDRETGYAGTGFGRWWVIERGTTESALHKTMFAAAKMIVDHELMEAFKVDNKRPFDPHRSVQHLIATVEEGR